MLHKRNLWQGGTLTYYPSNLNTFPSNPNQYVRYNIDVEQTSDARWYKSSVVSRRITSVRQNGQSSRFTTQPPKRGRDIISQHDKCSSNEDLLGNDMLLAILNECFSRLSKYCRGQLFTAKSTKKPCSISTSNLMVACDHRSSANAKAQLSHLPWRNWLVRSTVFVYPFLTKKDILQNIQLSTKRSH